MGTPYRTPPSISKSAIPVSTKRVTPNQDSKSSTAKESVICGSKPQSGVNLSIPSSLKKVGPSPQDIKIKTKTPQRGNIAIKNPLRRLQEAAKAEVRQKTEQDKKYLKSSNTPWRQKHQPQTLDELFVNKMKIKEVENWLLKAVEPSPATVLKYGPKPASKICLLSGPSGSGKTATIMTLAKHFNIDVKEWRSQCDLVEYDANSVFGDVVSWRNQTDIFVNFFSRSAQYSTLPIKGKNMSKSIVVVEELPISFYRDSSSFHNFLLNLGDIVNNPTVFIIGDGTSNGYNNVNSLFPKNILETLNIEHITFNPVADKFMLSYLNWVCQQENVVASKAALDEITKVSAGDVGSAINGLQYSLTTQRKKEQKSIFKKPFAKDKETGALFKDENLFLFHALGKVFYAKRNSNDRSVDERVLVPRLQNEVRIHPMLFVPEDLLNKIEVSSDLFLMFLQQNYLLFFSSLVDSMKALSCMTDAEQILSTWIFDGSGSEKGYKVRERKDEIATSIAIRAIIHYNLKPSSNSFKPYRKPLSNDLQSRMQQTVDDYQYLIPAQAVCLQSHYYTDIAPYYLKIKKFLPRDKARVLRHVFDADSRKFGCYSAFKEDTKLDDLLDITKEQDIPYLNQCKISDYTPQEQFLETYENPHDILIEEYDSD